MRRISWDSELIQIIGNVDRQSLDIFRWVFDDTGTTLAPIPNEEDLMLVFQAGTTGRRDEKLIERLQTPSSQESLLI